MLNKKNNGIDFDRLNELVDNGIGNSDDTSNIGTNENYHSKKNYRPNLHTQSSNEGFEYNPHTSGTRDYQNSNHSNASDSTIIGGSEKYNTKKNYDSGNYSSSNHNDGNYKTSRQSAHPKSSRLKSMYVVNLTATRVGIVAGVFFSLILMIFVIGFQMGSGKDKKPVATTNSSSEELLFRSNADKDIINVANVGNNVRTSEPTRTDIVSIDLLSQNSSTATSSVATDDISSMVSRDLQDLGQSLNSSSKSANSINSTDNLLNSYVNAEPASYIPGENTPSTFTVSSQTQTQSVSSSSQTSDNGLVYYIQVAVAGTERSANAERDFLRGKSFTKAFVVDGIAKDGSTMYKLKIGRYTTKSQAEQALASLKALSSKYSDSYIYPDRAS